MTGIKQNLFWAFIYNIIGIPLAAGLFFPFFGWLLNPIFAGLAMAFQACPLLAIPYVLRQRTSKYGPNLYLSCQRNALQFMSFLPKSKLKDTKGVSYAKTSLKEKNGLK